MLHAVHTPSTHSSLIQLMCLLGTGEQEELMDIQTDETAKIKHKECCPINF